MRHIRLAAITLCAALVATFAHAAPLPAYAATVVSQCLVFN